MVPSPVMRAMDRGSIVRIEELTRLPSDVQDALITVLSEKSLPVPELATEVLARHGFNLIATANDRDRGVNELSSALRRRFNTVVLPSRRRPKKRCDIVTQRVAALGAALSLPPSAAPRPTRSAGWSTCSASCAAARATTAGSSSKTPSGTMSTAEAISVIVQGMSMAVHMGDGRVRFDDLLAGIEGTVVRDPVHDSIVWREYLDSLATR